MGWEDLFNLHLEGNIIGAHTKTHQDLSSIENEYNLLDEIVYSADRIEKKLGISINSFAYPFGKSINLKKQMNKFYSVVDKFTLDKMTEKLDEKIKEIESIIDMIKKHGVAYPVTPVDEGAGIIRYWSYFKLCDDGDLYIIA